MDNKTMSVGGFRRRKSNRKPKPMSWARVSYTRGSKVNDISFGACIYFIDKIYYSQNLFQIMYQFRF